MCRVEDNDAHISELLSDGVHHATKRYEVGDPNLIEEKGNQLDLTYEWSDEHLGFILNPFYNNIDDLNIPARRADIIPVAWITIACFMKHFGIQHIEHSKCSLKMGILKEINT